MPSTTTGGPLLITENKPKRNLITQYVDNNVEEKDVDP